MKKSSKKLMTMLLMMCLILIMAVPVSADAAAAAKGTAKAGTEKKSKKIKTKVKTAKITVNKNKVIVVFKGKVQYKDPVVTVKDADGNELEAKIIKKTKSQMKLKVAGMEKGKEYTLTVSGIKKKKEKDFGTITKTFKKKK